MDIGTQEINHISRMIPGDISVYEVDGACLRVLYFSDGVPGISGMDADEYRKIISDDASHIVYEPDRSIVADKLAESLSSSNEIDLVYRILHKVHGVVWVHAKARLIGSKNGHPVLLSIFMETSLETEFHEVLLDHAEEAVYVYDASSMKLFYANATAKKIWDRFDDIDGSTCYSFFHDFESPCPWCEKMSSDDMESHVKEAFDEKSDRYFRFDRQRVSWYGRDAIAVFATDITDISKARDSLTLEKTRLEAIIENIPAGICVYKVSDGNPKLLAANEHMRNLLDADSDRLSDFSINPLINRVNPDDREEARRVSHELMAGFEEASCDFRLKSVDNGEYKWLHLDGRTMKQPEGSLLVFTCVTDVTAQKFNEEHFKKAVGDLLSGNPQALCAFEMNLTLNTCEEGRGISEFVQSALASDTADGIFENLANIVVGKNDIELCRNMFNRTSLIAAFESGKSHLSIEYRRKSENGRSIWAKTFISMMRNPKTNDIEAVVYSVDIDGQKRKEQAHHLVTENGYDYIALINVDDCSFEFQNLGSTVDNRYRDDFEMSAIPQTYDAVIDYAVGSWVYPEDSELFVSASSIKNIIEHLDSEGHYEFSLRGVREDNDIRRKRIEYVYLDDTKHTIVVWQTDISAAVLKEQEDSERLEVALAAAKQASNAKSVFLSRMSHEIRTPMNAIIGMDTLAAQAIGNDSKVADCIAKIGISSRYLLSLINDILDMSRIESGKMMLKNEPFSFRDLITQVDDIIYGQAEAKGLEYECIIAKDIEESYIGDAMKLQQVLVNILGNAVKFTDAGKVSFSIHHVSRKGNNAKIRFVVNDTGKGMTESEQKKIFDPFEQVDTTTTTTFGGTGLGLAITKSLVELMGGTIRVRSISGIGSEFTVEIPLEIDEETLKKSDQKHHFDKMHTLIVDDDLVVCEQTNAILDEIGMIGEWVTSGFEAIERVKKRKGENKDYNFILVDWKMPEMDGIETTRHIREIVGPDVTIIIITAYDWQSIEYEAKAAGANLLVTKPLFKSTLVSAFEKSQGYADAASAEPVNFVFTGKKVLVAEDNSINAEIAQGLLESKGFSVDIAHDGLEAMEMFAQSPVGYYDAILMDVRMPQMDGLQSASNIRRWKKDDAATIPIIAMTANAFDEDVEKSRAAGMNAHLAKPIEPEILYRTLYRAFNDDLI